MKLYAPVLAGTLTGALMLAACGQRSEPAAPQDRTASAPEVPVMGRERRILALGDSLFAGYGLRQDQSYPSRLEAALRAQGINARIANAGVSGDTTGGGLERLSFTLGSPVPPELAIVSLGGNDMLRGLPPEQTRANLDAILAEFQRRGIKVVLMGMLAPPNMGPDYRGKFDAIYPELARKYDAALVPFFLEAVIGKPDLVQRDHIHPTDRGIEEMVAETADEVAGALPT